MKKKIHPLLEDMSTFEDECLKEMIYDQSWWSTDDEIRMLDELKRRAINRDKEEE